MSDSTTAPQAVAGFDSPYRGLEAYGEEHAAFFFGRTRERDVIVANLMARRLTLLYGESGVGKSSVLQAGAAASLRGSQEFVPVVFRSWRDDPVAGIARAAAEAVAETRGVGVDVGATDRLDESLTACVKAAEAELLVILDQFEEFFLYHAGEDGDGTLAVELPRLVNADLPVNVLIAIREDALAKLDRFKTRIAGLFDSYLRIEPLDEEAARAAIEKPLEEFNRGRTPADAVSVEPGLVDAVIEQVGAGKVVREDVGRGGLDGAPTPTGEGRIETPYLQLVLTRLWDEEVGSGSRVLRLATLERLGGAQTIVRTHLDEMLATLGEEDADLAADVFHHLVTPSGTKIAHSPPDLAAYSGRPEEELEAVLERLSSGDVRILRPVAPPPGRPEFVRYEIFHDVLAPAILDWRTRYREAKGRREAELRLTASQAEARRQRRRARIFRVVATVATLLAVAAAALAFAVTQQRKTARSQALAAEAIAALSVDPTRSVDLAKRALDVKHTTEAENALREAFDEFRAGRVFRAGAAATSAAFSPDGTLVAIATDGDVAEIRDVRTGELVRTLRGHSDDVNSVAFSADGERVVTASNDRTARIWPLAGTGRPVILRGHIDWLSAATFSPDGRRVATSSGDRTVRIWSVRTGRTVATLRGHADAVTSVAFSRDGRRVVTTSDDETARVWDLANGREKARLDQDRGGHRGSVLSAAFGPDGRHVVTAGDDKKALVWQLTSSDPKCCWILAGHTGAVTDAEFSPDGHDVLTASNDGTVRLWEWRLEQPLLELRGHTAAVSAAAFRRDGKAVVTASVDGTARTWSLANLATVEVRSRFEVLDATLSPNARAAVVVDDQLRLWSIRGPRQLWHRGKDTLPVTATFSADGAFLVTAGEDGDAHVWRSRTGEHLKVLRHPGEETFSASFSPDGRRIVTTADDGKARIWNWRAHAEARTFGTGLSDAAFSPDGTRIVTAHGNRAEVWDVHKRRRTLALRGHSGAVRSVAFSSDGRRIVSASDDKTARIWDTGSGGVEHVLGGHNRPVLDAAFSADGRYVATVGADRTTRVWGAESGRIVAVLHRHVDKVNTVQFARGGTSLFTASDDTTAKIYPCEGCRSLSKLLDLLQQREKGLGLR